MSWTKVIICDICGTQHKFWRTVGSERDLIGSMLGWQSINVGRSVYDICKKCKGDASKEQLTKFFQDNPIKNETFYEIVSGAFKKGFSKD